MRWFFLFLSLLTLSCSQELKPATAISVSVKTNLLVGSEITEIWYRVYPRDADPTRESPVTELTTAALAVNRPFIIEKGEDRELLVAVQGLGPQGRADPVVEYKVRARFEDGKTVELPIFLDKACFKKGCTEIAGQTCHWKAENGVAAGSCGPIPFPQGLTVIEDGADADKWATPAPMDAGTDAGDAMIPDSCMTKPDGGVCDPLAQCGCPDNLNCQISNGAPFCAPTGALPKGSRCRNSGECARGLACSYESCSPMCATDAECGGGTCLKKQTEQFGFCLMRCGQPSDAPCAPGIACSPLRLSKNPGIVNYCIQPKSPCPYVQDDECDEPTVGSGWCARGTDTADCSSGPSPSACNLVTQSGCTTTQSCQIARITGTTATTQCGVPGTKPVGSLCTLHTECLRGHACVDGICAKLCSDGPQCGGTAGCYQITNNMDQALVPEVGFCQIPCNTATGVPCAAGTVCKTSTVAGVGSYCSRP